MTKAILVPMFILPILAVIIFIFKGQYSSAITWGGISMANFGLWISTT